MPRFIPRRHVSTADVNSAVLASGRCRLGHLSVSNAGAAAAYLKLYDQASAPAATDTPKHTIPLAATSYNQSVDLPSSGLSFDEGLAIRITGALADSDATAVGADEVVVNYSLG